jgi:hypothetical protein
LLSLKTLWRNVRWPLLFPHTAFNPAKTEMRLDTLGRRFDLAFIARQCAFPSHSSVETASGAGDFQAGFSNVWPARPGNGLAGGSGFRLR